MIGSTLEVKYNCNNPRKGQYGIRMQVNPIISRTSLRNKLNVVNPTILQHSFRVDLESWSNLLNQIMFLLSYYAKGWLSLSII